MANGLSEFDSGRIAEQAVEGLVECAVTHESIRLAVLDEVLLSLSRRNEAGRNIARSRAMEALAELRARQAAP